jgi:beta-lactamase class D
MHKLIISCLLTALIASCSLNNAEEDNSLEKYFKENNVAGTFGMFNNGSGEFTMYNMNRYRDSAYSPFQTSKIVDGLIGLEMGIIKDSLDLVKNDSFTIPKNATDHWLDTLGYNSMKITADEQLGLVKKLYFGQLPFQPRSQRIVKNSMKKEDNANYTLNYQAGNGITAQNHALGWLIGWIEENRHPHFFVLQTESPDSSINMNEVDISILKSILKQYGYMQGKR